MPKSVHISRLKKASLRDMTIFQHKFIIDPDKLPCGESEIFNIEPVIIQPRVPIRKVVSTKLKKKKVVKGKKKK